MTRAHATSSVGMVTAYEYPVATNEERGESDGGGKDDASVELSRRRGVAEKEMKGQDIQ